MASRANASVEISDDMPLERAIGKLKKTLAQNGTFRRLKALAFYEKPSVARRRKSAFARKRLRKAEQRSLAHERQDS